MRLTKAVVNTHVPYVCLVEVSFLLLQDVWTTDSGNDSTGKVSRSTTVTEWLQHSFCINQLHYESHTNLVIEDTLSWTSQVCHWSVVIQSVLVPPERGGRWRLMQASITLVNVDVSGSWASAGRTTAASCRGTRAWLGLMNCLVEQNCIMLVCFKRIWQVLKYTGWWYNLNHDTAEGKGRQIEKLCLQTDKCYTQCLVTNWSNKCSYF